MKTTLILEKSLFVIVVIGCSLFPIRDAAGLVVAREDFENDLEAIGPGSGTTPPSLLGPPQGDAGIPGRWVTNGFNQAPGPTGDTNANLRVSDLALGGAPLLNPPGSNSHWQAFYECKDGDYSMGGILKFTDPDGNPIVAKTGDRIVGECQVLWQDGGFGFALVSSIDTLRQEQASVSWTNSPPLVTPPYNPTDIPTPHQGGPYFTSISGMIAMTTPANGLIRAVVDNGSGEVQGVVLEDEMLYPYEQQQTQFVFQKISFDYTVGSNVYNHLSVERFVDPNDIGQGVISNEFRVLSDGGPVPVGAVKDSIEAITFCGGDGLHAEYFLDEITIELIPLPVPSVPFTNVVVNDVLELDFLSDPGETYDLEYTEDILTGTFTNAGAATLTGNGGVLTFFDPAGPSATGAYRINQQ